jgi:hypothetical protein
MFPFSRTLSPALPYRCSFVFVTILPFPPFSRRQRSTRLVRHGAGTGRIRSTVRGRQRLRRYHRPRLELPRFQIRRPWIRRVLPSRHAGGQTRLQRPHGREGPHREGAFAGRVGVPEHRGMEPKRRLSEVELRRHRQEELREELRWADSRVQLRWYW